MNTMPTAEQFAANFTTSKDSETTGEYISSMLIEFAKLHVQASLEEASMKAELDLTFDYKGCEISKSSIINAYPLSLIK
jgi:hypothetical protein